MVDLWFINYDNHYITILIPYLFSYVTGLEFDYWIVDASRRALSYCSHCVPAFDALSILIPEFDEREIRKTLMDGL
jgi:hypothetical protein